MSTEISSPILELQRQRTLLQMEYDEEKRAFQQQTEAQGMLRRVKRGDAWMPLRVGKSYFNSLNQYCVEVFRQPDDDTDHNFEYGRPVQFFVQHEKTIRFFSATGTVSYVDGDRMVIAVPDGFSVADLQISDGQLGVQLFFDETSYRLMFEALDRTMRAKGRLAYLRDLFYSKQKAETFSFPDMGFSYLNATQQHAVNEVLRAKDVAIVHGPPGTGKTTTLVEAIYETLRRESQVLVCAQSNMAVDWISEKLVDRGLNVLRIGNPVRVDDKMLSFTYEREIRINAEIFGEARVIACTLVGSANRLLDGMKFGTLFIDEAAQALEAACWIPIRRAGRVILAGDHCQLPPTVKCYEALKGGLGRTLMERIAEQKPEVVTLLRIQYRMHEDIMRFSSDWFYHNRMIAAPEVQHRSILDLDLPMTWIDTSLYEGKEEFVGESFGRVNKTEAELTLLSLQAYFELIGKQRILDERLDVGIISPYRAQVQYLRSQIRKKEWLKPFRTRISVNTVDGFQGQERDIIVISLVRSNDDGQIGFLRDLRRMNVAITRARMKLIILGDRQTMTRHPFYRKLWDYVSSLKQDK